MTKPIEYIKLLLENKYILILIVGMFTGTATNADRIFSKKAVIEIKQEIKHDVNDQVEKKAEEFKKKYENHPPQPHTHKPYIDLRFKQHLKDDH